MAARAAALWAAGSLGFAPIAAGEGSGAPLLEARIVRTAPCDDCSTVRFPNELTESELLLVPRACDASFRASDIERVEAIEEEDRIFERRTWSARILLTRTGMRRAHEFVEKHRSPTLVMLLSAGGKPIDVEMSGTWGDGLRLGLFDSLDDLRASFPGAVRVPGVHVIEGSDDFKRLMRELEAAGEDDGE
jgi:hypothetical protein